MIPQTGGTNGVSGVSEVQKVDAAVDTVVAVMYNYYDDKLISSNEAGLITNSSNVVTLNPYGSAPEDDYNMSLYAPHALKLDAFLALFYPTNSGYFNVNPSNRNNPAVILSEQTYSSSNSTLNKFSLVQFLLRAYCTNKGVNVNSLDPRILLILQKECFQTQSLTGIRGTTISMSWDEVINSLIRSGVMDPSGAVMGAEEAGAVVPLSIVLNYHSFVLDIDLSIKFTYLVDITGYALPDRPPAQPTL